MDYEPLPTEGELQGSQHSGSTANLNSAFGLRASEGYGFSWLWIQLVARQGAVSP